MIVSIPCVAVPRRPGGLFDFNQRKMLAARVKPFLLRRTKNEVATDLPPKTEIVERIEFGAAQRDLYESVRLSKLVAVGTIEEKIEILRARKQALAESIFDHDGAPTLSITEDDIAMLFESVE